MTLQQLGTVAVVVANVVVWLYVFYLLGKLYVSIDTRRKR